jgi:uncharacterized protein YbbC (DUF1343 family)
MFWFLYFLLLPLCLLSAQVKVGVDVLFDEGLLKERLYGKNVGLITNHTAIDKLGCSTFERFAREKNIRIKAIFAPEHGYYGSAHASEYIEDENYGEMPIYSLHGASRRPSEEQLKDIDILVFDMQDIGTRSYTYIGTLFYCMEEAAKKNIEFMVLDRPNPQGGLIVDGPLMDTDNRSFLGYINIPYCHGMTLAELAQLFNAEYQVGCRLFVIPMRGWRRSMLFSDTGLKWVPTSPQVPEPDTALYYPTTGLLGFYSSVSIGVGYTLPFKVVGAPWIDAEKFAAACNAQKLPGVHFHPFYFKPFFGRFKGENCQGVYIMITQPNQYLPVTTGYTITGVLKNLHPEEFEDGLKKNLASTSKKETCLKLTGKQEIVSILLNEKFIIWKLREVCHKDREQFLKTRKKYLIADYT